LLVCESIFIISRLIGYNPPLFERKGRGELTSDQQTNPPRKLIAMHIQFWDESGNCKTNTRRPENYYSYLMTKWIFRF